MKLPFIAAAVLAGALQLPAAESNSISVTVGEEFKITLKYNATTGYQWQFPKPIDAKLIVPVQTNYSRLNTNLVGSGGDQTWTFKAVGEGKTKIDFAYVRPWEHVKPVQTTNFVVVIHPAPKKDQAAPPN